MRGNNKTEKFWTFISKRTKAEAALADWRLELGNELDFDKLQKLYLAPTDMMARDIMCPEQCNPSCGFRKVCEWDGKYEAVCRERRRKDYNIEKADALFFTVKPSGLLPAITKIFKIIPHIEEFGKEEDTWKLGVVPVSGGKSATIYLTLKVWNHEIMDLIYRLNCEEHKPYILLVTARKIVHGTSEKVLNDMGSAFVPLNEVLDFNAQTEFELLRECNLAQLVAPPTPEPESEPEPENIFRKCGDAWKIRFDGGEKFMLTTGNIGTSYLHFMLARPNISTPVLEILRSVSGESEDYISSVRFDIEEMSDGFTFHDLPSTGTGNIADETAVREYRKEAKLLLKEIENAKENGNNIEAIQLQRDLNKLTAAINEAVSPAGQKRALDNPLRNIANTFRNAVNRTLDRIQEHDSNLSEHLRKTLKLGLYPAYLPTKKYEWYC